MRMQINMKDESFKSISFKAIAMIDKRCACLLVVILFQSIAIYGAQKPETKPEAESIAQQQLKIALENNALICQNNALLTELLKAVIQANALAAEHVKAVQEQNKIHLALVQM